MKIKVICYLLLMLINSVIVHPVAKYSLSVRERLEWYNKSTLEHPKSHLYTSEDVVQLVETIVPSKYVRSFLKYSVLEFDYQTDVFRIYLLGLGEFESGWVKTRSHTQNDNGSYDWGFLMLNDANIASKKFMTQYGPNEHFETKDRYELYLIVCIQYFKELFYKYGCDGLYAYNAGERSYVLNKIPDITYIYKYRVKVKVDNILTRLYSIAEENRLKRQQIYHKEREEIILRSLARINEKHNLDLLRNGNIRTSIDVINTPIILSDITYDPKKRLIYIIQLRRFIVVSRENLLGIEDALQNV